MLTTILTLIGILIYLIHLWIYGWKIHKVMEERDFWKEQAEIADQHTLKILNTYITRLNQIPRSVRDYYRNLNN